MVGDHGAEDPASLAYSEARLAIARLNVGDQTSLASVFRRAASISAHTLGVGRVGIWLFDSAGTSLRCECLHIEGQPPVDITQLRPVAYPTYIAALKQHRWICVDDAQQDPLTRELTDDYLRPLGISSMLDAPILHGDDVIGIVCHEHVGAPRSWRKHEQAFAGAVADMVAVYLEQAQRLEAEARLRRHEAQMRELQKMEALGRMGAAVAHDMNNLLSAIDTLASFAARGTADARVLEQLKAIREVTARGAKLSRQLLQFGRPASPLRAPLDLVRAVSELEPVLRTLCGPRISLAIDRPERALPIVADVTEVQQIVVNLVINARDAMPQGGVVQVRLSPDDDIEPARVKLEVIDQGVGIDEATQAHIFEPYFTTKPQGEGTGLGLSTVYVLVQSMGGRISVRSAPGRGAAFSVSLPRHVSMRG